MYMQASPTVAYASDALGYSYKNVFPYSDIIASHVHYGWEFLFIKQGELSYSVEGNVFHVSSGDLIITRPGSVHMLHPKNTIRYERYDLVISDKLLNKSLLKSFPENLHILDISEDEIILSLFEKINYYISKLPKEHLEPIFHALSYELLLNIYIKLQTFTPSVTSYSHHIITKAIDFIKNHIQEPLNVQQVSDALFISTTYLQQCFIKHIQVTPKQYILLQKLQLVQRELANGANPTEASRRYGFHNYSTFYRNYQKIYGHCPSDKSKLPPQDIYL
jgi:AraC-like DNA-binding protein